jgi:transcriptional regulator with PAS, ATPase and Fis domain
VETEPGRFGLIGRSPTMRELYFSIERVAQVDIPVLILGETGTGKELVARAIHAASERASGRFVALNCAAIPTSLLQSELFGYEKGAFTGAFESKIGLIETAAGGTLLLDEIGEMPIQTQASLLRFLEDKNVTPIGGTRTIPVDVRVIASTNRDLQQGINDNAFREDLFYRLAVFTVQVPSLRDRGDDIDALARHFLQLAAEALNKPAHHLTHDALALLRRHNWPGNLRELRSWIFQAVLESSGHKTHGPRPGAGKTIARSPHLSQRRDGRCREEDSETNVIAERRECHQGRKGARCVTDDAVSADGKTPDFPRAQWQASQVDADSGQQQAPKTGTRCFRTFQHA